MAKSYIGKAPLTMAKTAEGGYVYVYEGAPVPANIDTDDLTRLVDEGFLEEDKKAAAKASSSSTGGSAEPTTVKDILAAVGDDKAKAQEYLEKEKAGENRSTLVEKLEAIANPAPAGS